MVANTEPIFPSTPNLGVVKISTANTAVDGTGTIGTVLTGGANGTRIKRITAKIEKTGASTAGMIRLFISDGATIFLWREIPVTAVTQSATVASWTSTIYLYGDEALFLPATWTLMASTEKAESFTIVAEGEDY